MQFCKGKISIIQKKHYVHVQLDDGKKYMVMTTYVQMAKSNNDKVDVPQPADVILGRGKSHSMHPGNVIFQGT